ncbi:putative phage tail protein [Veillonella sp.]|uniref:putative phage tail protein n=1 Tax=Veillonella sp. TaxID=1926307 RepID=UPI0025D27099|nr:putative phage tail protein [Veillonella sp.]
MFDFIRQKEVDISQYLPNYLSKDKHFKAINDAKSREHERLRQFKIELIKQLFPETATWGLKYWEEYLHIEDVAENIQDRREAVLLKINSNSVSTIEFMESLANKYIVDKSARIEEVSKEYYFNLFFSRDKCINLDQLKKWIEVYKPSHLGYKLYEEYQLEQKLKLGGIITISEALVIETADDYTAPQMEQHVAIAGAIYFEENSLIGGA